MRAGLDAVAAAREAGCDEVLSRGQLDREIDAVLARRAAVAEIVQPVGEVQLLRRDLDLPLARRMLIGALEEVELNWLLSDRSHPLTPVAARVAALRRSA
mgnify:CR=1 FL=1